jgi:periplasmic protein TonB
MRRIVMPETGFFAQKQHSPTSLAVVVLLHAALISAVILIKGPAFTRLVDTTTVRLIPLDPDPPPNPPPPEPQRPLQPQHQQERIDLVPPVTPTQPLGPPVDTRPQPTQLADNLAGNDRVELPPPPRPTPPPVRHPAQIDSSSQLQPPYPATELRAQRDGRVQVRVTIGPDGRVVDVALLSTTSDAFWQTTRQQALRYWRFRPATIDGRPVGDTRVMSVVFRIEDQG